MTTASQDAQQQVLAAIEVPSLDGLTKAQVHGTTCVWDGIALTPSTAVDLGPRLLGETGACWYPRGCKACVARAAYIALFTHAPACERCRTDASCPTAVATQRLMREGGL